MEIIHTEQAPAAIGPYSQGYIMGGIVYTSGQIPEPCRGDCRAGGAELQECCRAAGSRRDEAGKRL